MADEAVNTEAVTIDATGNPGTPPGGEQKMLAQEEVNRLVAQARKEGRESALKGAKAQPKPEAPQGDDGDKLTLKELKAQLDEEKRRNAFDKRVAKFDLSEEAQSDLFDLYKAQNPADPAAWFEAKAKLFGGAKEPSTPNGNGHREAARPPAAAPTEPARNGALPTQSGIVDVFNLSDAQLSALGPAGIRAEFEKIIAVANSQSGAPPIPRPMQKAR